MKKWIFASIALFFISFAPTAWATQHTDQAATQQVIEDWFASMKTENIDKSASFLAPQFTSIHTDGIVRDKKQELNMIKKLHMKNYQLTQFKFSQSGNTMVVTYKDKGTEQIDNKAMATKPAGRMAVLEKKDGKWLILAYANLDPVAK